MPTKPCKMDNILKVRGKENGKKDEKTHCLWSQTVLFLLERIDLLAFNL